MPLVRTRYGEAERLGEQFAADQFHLVHASNSLDHSDDPLDGLHQWNVDVEDGRFIIWRPGIRRVLEEELAGSDRWRRVR